MKIQITEGTKTIVIDTDELMRKEIVLKTQIPSEIGFKMKRKYVKHKKSKQKLNKRYPRHYKFWTIEEKAKLIDMNRNGLKAKKIAVALGRKSSDIRLALYKAKHFNGWIDKAINLRGKH